MNSLNGINNAAFIKEVKEGQYRMVLARLNCEVYNMELDVEASLPALHAIINKQSILGAYGKDALAVRMEELALVGDETYEMPLDKAALRTDNIQVIKHNELTYVVGDVTFMGRHAVELREKLKDANNLFVITPRFRIGMTDISAMPCLTHISGFDLDVREVPTADFLTALK